MLKYKLVLTVAGISIFLSSCSTPPHNFYSSIQPSRTIKEKVTCFIEYIATSNEKQTLELLNSEEELNNFLIEFWWRRDTNTTTEENEFKETYVKRFTYANTYLGGWQTDRARAYILYGAPDEIISETMNNLPVNIYQDYEVWVYDKKTVHPELPNMFVSIAPGKVKYVFADKMGFGVKEQIYSTEDNEKIDAKVYRYN
ncbi:MAG: GWxTD domain-containing protein [Ignavibacteriaceae bacterium]|jgi:GWxTD domain-containing protein